MEELIKVFMLFAGAVCVFAVVTVLRDYFKERKEVMEKKQREDEKTETATVPIAEAVTVQAPAVDENGVWINRGTEKNHAEKYAALSSEMRARYDLIKAYAMGKEEVVARMGVRAEDFRIGKRMVARLAIRREVVYCEYQIVHREMKECITENKVNVKQAAAVIKVDSDEAVMVAKNSIDLAVREIEEDKKIRYEMQKARRRENRARRN